MKFLLEFFFFFFVNNTKYFNTHMGRREKILKKLTMVYIYKDLTLEY